jgi:hypothetical protein
MKKDKMFYFVGEYMVGDKHDHSRVPFDDPPSADDVPMAEKL